MAKDPAFLFYSSDFLTGTFLMSSEEVGKYIRLLCVQHQKGHLTKKDMLNICSESDEKIWEKFSIDENGCYYNERLEDEAKKRKAYSESRKNNRKKKENTNTSETYVQHMENENENINENIDKNNRGVQGGITNVVENNFSEPIDPLKVPVDKIAELYKEHCPKLFPLKGLTHTRRQKICERWRENPDLKFWEEVFKTANNASVKEWKPTFDWIVENDTNYMKIIEGNYNDTGGSNDKQNGKPPEEARVEDSYFGKRAKEYADKGITLRNFSGRPAD